LENILLKSVLVHGVKKEESDTIRSLLTKYGFNKVIVSQNLDEAKDIINNIKKDLSFVVIDFNSIKNEDNLLLIDFISEAFSFDKKFNLDNKIGLLLLNTNHNDIKAKNVFRYDDITILNYGLKETGLFASIDAAFKKSALNPGYSNSIRQKN